MIHKTSSVNTDTTKTHLASVCSKLGSHLFRCVNFTERTPFKRVNLFPW